MGMGFSFGVRLYHRCWRRMIRISPECRGWRSGSPNRHWQTAPPMIRLSRA